MTTACLAEVTALAAMSAVTMVELVTVCVEPAKWAMPTPGVDATTHVGHVTVFVLKDRGDENVEPMPVRLKLVHAQALTFEVGAGYSFI